MANPFPTFDGLGNILSGMGGSADKRSGGYYFHNPMSSQQIDACYRSSWLARKIIDLPASEMTRPARDWQADNADVDPLEKLEKKLRVWAKLEEAVRLGRMGGGMLFMGVNQGTPDQPLDVARVRQGDLLYLYVMSRDDVNLGPLNYDPLSPFYGQPLYYEVLGAASMVRIHPSRVIPFKGRYVPRKFTHDLTAFWGDSVLDSINDALQNADTAQNGFAALIHEAKVDIWGIHGFAENMETPEDEARLIKRFTLANTMKSLHNSVIKDSEDEWEYKQINFSGFKDVILTYLGIVAGAAEMPATVLLGKAPDGMNATGDGDKENWYRTLDGWRESVLTPPLDTLDEVLVRSALGDKPDDVWWTFGPLEEESEAKRSDTIKKIVDTAKVAIDAGMPSEPMLEATANAMVESGLYPGLDAGMDALRAELAEPPAESEAQAANAIAGIGDASPRTLYVRRDVKNVAEIAAWAKSQGLPELQDGLHVTVLYSKRPVDWIKMGQAWGQFGEDKGRDELIVSEGGPRVVEPLGDRTAVLMFASNALTYRHKEMIEAGAPSDYSDYIAHISLTGEPVDLDGVVPYRGKIVLGPEIFEEVKA